MAAPAFLPYGRQAIDEDDIAAVTAALRADYLTSGPAVETFERAFAAQVGAPHAVACNSGTAALHLACIAAGLGAGDRLVVPSMTFVATANAARFVGAEVQFADVDPDTGLLTEATLADALDQAKRAGRSVKAISAVHLGGRTAPMRALAAIAQARGLPIVEDACHALGTTHDHASGASARVGDCRHGTLATFSFHPVKTMTVGEGGMVTTKDAEMAARMRLARNHGITRDPGFFQDKAAALDDNGSVNPWYYEMHEPGYNYRLPDLLCALGLSQLAKLERFMQRRRALAAQYEAALAPLAPLLRTVPPVPDCDPVLHLFAVLIDFEKIGMSRHDFMAGLKQRGIGSQVHYIPVHRQPYYRDRYGSVSLPGADAYYRRALSLPLFPSMGDADVGRVVAALAELVKRP